MCIDAPIDPHWYTYTHILLYIQIRLSIYRALIIQKNRGQTMHRYTDPWTETIIQDCIGFYWSESDFCKDLHSDVKKLKWRVAKNGCWTTPEQRRKMIQSFAVIREREREREKQNDKERGRYEKRLFKNEVTEAVMLSILKHNRTRRNISSLRFHWSNLNVNYHSNLGWLTSNMLKYYAIFYGHIRISLTIVNTAVHTKFHWHHR